jgi:murein DD-endopeptidase MepM/ murein hydrolase activator NlpD
VLPSLAAALVVTATGATVPGTAGSARATVRHDGQQAPASGTQQAAEKALVADRAARRQAIAQAAAQRSRVEARARAARSAKRKAVAAARARAAAERRARAERWVRPISVWKITSRFGPRWGTTHDGIDLGARTGTPVRAMSTGVVTGSFYDSSFGNKLEIRYWDGSISWYGHLSRRVAQRGDTVRPGQLVGLVGDTGHSFGSHLHLELQKSPSHDTPMDPMAWLRKHGLS